jgi:cytochrome c oxidase assembly protein subunit 15
MGCPDWPTCFGRWMPPTRESELPDAYKEYYVNYRHEKNLRFAGYLSALGFESKAELIRNDHTIRAETEFNTAKTWTEYINRLVGALIGIFVIINLIASARLIRTHTRLFVVSLLLLILVVFQGWIGSIVVSTNLVPWVVTLHMLLAMLVVAILLYLVYVSRKETFEARYRFTGRPMVKVFLILSFVLLATQVLLGTQVRETIDAIAASFEFGSRSAWIAEAGIPFLIHRSFSIAVILSQALLLLMLFRHPSKPAGLIRLAWLLLVCTLLEAALGAAMGYFSIPAFIQPVHLFVAVIVFGIQFLFILLIQNEKNIGKSNIAG